jgi:hypothetical protein
MEQEKLFLHAHVLAAEGRLDRAMEKAEAVLSADRRRNRRTALVDDLWFLAHLHRDAGDVRAARNTAKRAVAVLEAMSPPEMTARRRENLSGWLTELETPAE